VGRPPTARVLVDAGPGTGKTHVACTRVAALIADGVPAARIWLISFTRTAVVEIRNRIASALSDPGEAAAVRVKDEYDNHNVADDFYYTITVKQNGQAKTVKVADIGGKEITPSALRDLIDALNSLQDTVAK
jgi:superfamily I DNA/RNA helicase